MYCKKCDTDECMDQLNIKNPIFMRLAEEIKEKGILVDNLCEKAIKA